MPPPSTASAADRPYHRLQALPRSVWLGSLVTSAGTPERRLVDARLWLDALEAGTLPAHDADFGDAEAAAPLRAAAGELGLPAFCRATPALAEQLLRALLWHLDRLVDLQPRCTRVEAIETVTAEFTAAWERQTSGLQEDLSLLLGLGDFAHLRWDSMQGHLRSRSWAMARRASEWLRELPELAELVRQLGRSRREAAAPPASAPDPAQRPTPPVPLEAIETRLPGAPGEIVGVHFSNRPERMLASEAVMLKHPLLKKLWGARHAEARLLSWDTTAVLIDWRPDPLAVLRAPAASPAPEPLARGPIIVCLDTSGSMRGAPENIAKAVVIAALQAAHAERRGCLLIAFGGPGELVERELGRGADGLEALMALMGQGFDGGTDIQTPISRAIDAVHNARWASADLLIVSDGEFGCVPQTLDRLDEARERFGLRVQGVLVGDRETMGLLELCDAIHWVRDWRRFDEAADARSAPAHTSPVHSKSLTALYFPNALSSRAARHRT